MSTYEDASLILPISAGRKAGKIYSLKPTDGTGDFTVVSSACDEIDINGDSPEVAANTPRYDYRADYVAPNDNSYYSFDGVDDYISLPNPTVSTVTNDFSAIINFRTSNDVSTLQIIYSNTLDANNVIVIGINTGSFSFSTVDGATGEIASIPILQNTEYTIAVTKPNTHTGLKKIYVNGVLQVLGTSSPLNYTTNVGQYLGVRTNISLFFTGDTYTIQTENYEMSASEVLDRYNGLPMPEKYKGANNIDVLASNVRIGGLYEIKTTDVSTDFTLIGASANIVGVQFIATGVTGGIGTARSIGNTLNLSTGKTASTWYDLDHAIEGVVTGATLTDSTDFGNNVHETETCPVLLTEPSFTNLFINSRTPVTQTITTVIGTTYTVNCKNTGIIAVEETGGNGQGGTATEVNPYTYTATQTSVTVTLEAGHNFDWVQLSDTDYAMNHIETAGVSVTKIQDKITGAGDVNTFDSTAGVLEFQIAALSDDLTVRAVSVSDGTIDNRVNFEYNTTSNRVAVIIKIGAATVYSYSETLTDITESTVFKIKWAASDYGFKINDIEVDSQSSGSVFTANTLTTLQLDSGAGSNSLNARTKYIQTYKGIENY